MTTAVRSLIESFDSLSESERQEAALEILRRQVPEDDVPEEVFTRAADDLFVALDAEEAQVG